jgi:thiol-disulfide isomerase/thioredoxin
MKTLTKIISVLFFCTIFFALLPQKINAQVSNELSRLLRSAGIQAVNQRTTPNDFTLPLLDGENVTLSSLKGKVVLLNFWATWCPPCREEMPSMEVLYQRYKDLEFEMLAVNLREDTNTIRQFMERNGFTFPVPLDQYGRVGSVYGIRSIPTTLIINKDGIIIGRIVGAIYWDTPQVFAVFDALLK